jgi:hypothetical protein
LFEDGFAEDSFRVGLLYRLLEDAVAFHEFAADIAIDRVRLNRVRGDQDAFDELVGVSLEKDPVLERPRLALVGVDDEGTLASSWLSARTTT